LPSANTPTLQVLAQQTDRLKRLSDAETGLLQGVDQTISARVDDLHDLLGRVGLNPEAVERQSPDGGIGGPFVPIQSVRIEGIADPIFTTAYENAVAHDSELSALFAALHHVPLTTPVHGAQFEVTSGFGPRVDPFTSRIAFHPGVDFAGPWGSTVVATAPGTVVWAGARAGYGNMVEIDHGNGFATRYGHLSKIDVKVGQTVRIGETIGEIGSTGRSTGPHLHYETRINGEAVDPQKFLRAGIRLGNV
jgi:murein DD-endopeptidase MepM/ murein hydrolase activator NlpD